MTHTILSVHSPCQTKGGEEREERREGREGRGRGGEEERGVKGEDTFIV